MPFVASAPAYRFVTPYQPTVPIYRNSYEPAPTEFIPTDDSPTSIVLRATIRAQSEPGVATELDPTGKQTATGGPSGGSPEFGGGGP